MFVGNVDMSLMLGYDHFRFVRLVDVVLDIRFGGILRVMWLVEDRFVNVIYQIVNLEYDG